MEILFNCANSLSPGCGVRHDPKTVSLYMASDNGYRSKEPYLVRLCQDQFDHFKEYGWKDLKPAGDDRCISCFNQFIGLLPNQVDGTLICHDCLHPEEK
jgi:hypothetical protein